MTYAINLHKESREISEQDLALLKSLAELVVRELDLKLTTRRIVHLEQTFNEELELKIQSQTKKLQAAQTQLVEKERLTVLGGFSSIIAHEVRSPL